MPITQLNQNATKIQHDLGNASTRVLNNINRLTSGKANIAASDNITNVSVSAQFSARVSALHAAATNANSASSLLQVAEGGLNSITDILSRMQELATLSTNTVYSDAERFMLDLEFQELKAEIDRLANDTRYNGIQVLVEPERELFPAINVDGSQNPDNITTLQGNDTIRGLDGDDVIIAGSGDDTIVDGTLLTPGLEGRIYRSGPFGGIANLAEAEAIVASQPVFANFISTSLDYPNGAQNNQNSNLNNLLGGDAASLDNPVGGTGVNRMVFVFEGVVNVAADGVYNFNVGTDDGFNLQIDGATVVQFPNNRGFNFTNGNTFLTAGSHDFRLLFWENGGQEGLEVFSNLTGGGILDDSVLFRSGNAADGNDTIDGGDGTDIVTFSGNAADYTVTQLAPNQFQVVDNRPGSPNGTDLLTDVELLRFADTDVTIGTFEEPPLARVLEWQVTEDASDEFLEYEIVDADLDALFSTPDELNIRTSTEAKAAIDEVKEAINTIIGYRSYVGSVQGRASVVSNELVSRIANQSIANAELSETDVPSVSTDYAAAQVMYQSGISILAQTNRLHGENVQTLTDEVLQFGERPLDGGPLVDMRTEFDL